MVPRLFPGNLDSRVSQAYARLLCRAGIDMTAEARKCIVLLVPDP